jgi:NTE family protein
MIGTTRPRPRARAAMRFSAAALCAAGALLAVAGARADGAAELARSLDPAPAGVGPAHPPPATAIDSALPRRPRIGLVLSGGGARGAAHVGVLEVLDELHVPIDAIAGTSMGAVVGGLYASGYSGKEIEAIFESVDWQNAFSDRPPRADLTFRRKQDDDNFLVHFPLGLKHGNFLLPRGLIGGQKLTATLRRLTLPVSRITDFDRLPTRFRAVATDLETGNAVIMGSGDLTTAMRASMSAPGVFTPVERDGELLVDGGVAENLPVDVARAMDVDILIVVDVGFPLEPRARLETAPSISNQMLAILIRRDANRQKATLTPRDIVIDPTLGQASSFDFSRLKRLISIGEQAAQTATSRLAPLALGPEAYASWVQGRHAMQEPPPRIEFVKIDPGSDRYKRALETIFDPVVGKVLDPKDMTRREDELYGQGNLETLDYQIVKGHADASADGGVPANADSVANAGTPADNGHAAPDGDEGLLLTARRHSWGPNYVRFGLNLQDDFQGNSTFNAAAHFVLSEITHLGGEWVWDLQVGETPRIATDFYLPLSYQSPYFIDPQARAQTMTLPVYTGQHEIAEYRLRTVDSEFDVGREFGNWGELRLGVLRESGDERVEFGTPSLGQDAEFNARELFVRLRYDKLDNVNFPREGQSATLEWRGERDADNGDRPVNLASFNYLIAESFGRNTAVFSTAGGSNLSPAGISLRTLYNLGGFLSLSGLEPLSLTGPDYAIARLLFYRKIGSGGEGFLNVPAYLGVSFEVGNVWQERRDVSFGSAHKDESLFLGLDTFLGPVFLGIGHDDGGGIASYLFLGRTF